MSRMDRPLRNFPIVFMLLHALLPGSGRGSPAPPMPPPAAQPPNPTLLMRFPMMRSTGRSRWTKTSQNPPPHPFQVHGFAGLSKFLRKVPLKDGETWPFGRYLGHGQRQRKRVGQRGTVPCCPCREACRKNTGPAAGWTLCSRASGTGLASHDGW